MRTVDGSTGSLPFPAWRQTLDGLVTRVMGMASTDACALIGELERVKALAWMRVQAPQPTRPTPSLDRYLTAGEVAERLGVKVQWVYAHRDDLGGVKMAGVVRYPERAIMRYLAGR